MKVNLCLVQGLHVINFSFASSQGKFREGKEEGRIEKEESERRKMKEERKKEWIQVHG